MQIQMALARII